MVFIGTLPGIDTSPVVTHTPLLGAELRIEADQTIVLGITRDFEHGLLVDSGQVVLEGQRLARGELGYVEPGREHLTITAGDQPVRAVLLGGEPFDDEIVMWWNFIGPDHEYVALAREQYESGHERFGQVEGYVGSVERISAPPLPDTRLRPRGRQGMLGQRDHR